MKNCKYEAPVVEILNVCVEDIVRTSTGNDETDNWGFWQEGKLEN